MRILICDDIRSDAENIKFNVKKFFINKKVDISICTPHDVMLQLDEDLFQYDIAILDIYYKACKFNGIDLAHIINDKSIACRIIFVSNNINYALSVYETVLLFLKEAG